MMSDERFAALPPNIRVRWGRRSRTISITGRYIAVHSMKHTLHTKDDVKQLGRLALAWRRDASGAALAAYQGLLQRLVANGFKEALDIDAELPEQYMPAEYLKLHR